MTPHPHPESRRLAANAVARAFLSARRAEAAGEFTDRDAVRLLSAMGDFYREHRRLDWRKCCHPVLLAQVEGM